MRYLYDPAAAKLLSLDEAGVLLIELCNGKNSIRDIMSLAGKKNERVVFDFYRTLFRWGFLR